MVKVVKLTKKSFLGRKSGEGIVIRASCEQTRPGSPAPNLVARTSSVVSSLFSCSQSPSSAVPNFSVFSGRIAFAPLHGLVHRHAGFRLLVKIQRTTSGASIFAVLS